jgi:hypothetical protein
MGGLSEHVRAHSGSMLMVITSEPPSAVVGALRHLDRTSLRAHLPPTCTALHGVYTFAADSGHVHARLTPVADDAPTPMLTRNGSASGQRRATARGVVVRKRRIDYEMVREAVLPSPRTTFYSNCG